MPKISELPLAALALTDQVPLLKTDGNTHRASIGDIVGFLPPGPQGAQGVPGPQGPPGDISTAWPVGSIFMTAVSTNPSTLLGFGTWVAFGAGRVPVGFDAGQSEFDASEKLGGAKTHTLSVAELPAHTHVQNAHSHGLTRFPTTTGGSSGFTADTSMSGTPAAVTQATDLATAVNQNAGGGAVHNNLQPYIVIHMWKRTA
mgnify:CR=1 FL=1